MAESGHKGVKNARFDLIPYDALWQVALVFGKGAEKYAERNWQRGYEWSKSYGAMLRHLSLFWQGEDIDAESGLPHLAHATWHGLALTSFYLSAAGTDDRFKSTVGMQADVTNPDEIAAAQAEVVSVVDPEVVQFTPPLELSPEVEKLAAYARRVYAEERDSCQAAGGVGCDCEYPFCGRMRNWSTPGGC